MEVISILHVTCTVLYCTMLYCTVLYCTVAAMHLVTNSGTVELLRAASSHRLLPRVPQF